MPLALAASGDRRIVKSYYGSEEMKRHLESLGFVKGQEVEVLGGERQRNDLNYKGNPYSIKPQPCSEDYGGIVCDHAASIQNLCKQW